MDALARDLMNRLHEQGVSTVFVGDLTGVLETHRSVEVNAKTHNFWAFRAFVNRLACTAEEYSIDIEFRCEAWTSQTNPNCTSTESTTRHGDTLTCTCGFEGHADGTASDRFLVNQEANTAYDGRCPGPCASWNNHEWRPTTTAPRFHRTMTNEEHKPEYSREEPCLRGCGISQHPSMRNPTRFSRGRRSNARRRERYHRDQSAPKLG